MGGPDAWQIDGLGGGHPPTSKVAVVSPPSRGDADVDCLFLQATPATRAVVNPGDLVAADDDGVVVVRYDEVDTVAEGCSERIANEQEKRARFDASELVLDVYDMCDELKAKGLKYIESLDD